MNDNIIEWKLEEKDMGVLVCYDDYTYDVINDYHLDFLLESGCITGYDKSGEWVRVDDLSQKRLENSGTGQTSAKPPR